MHYRKADIVAWLRDLTNRVHDGSLSAEQKIELFWREGAERFPEAKKEDLVEAIAAYAVEHEAEQLECEQRAAALEYMAGFFERHGIANGTSWEDAVRSVAAQGDPEALILLNDLDSPESAVQDALLEAAVDAHPAWSRHDGKYLYDSEIGGPEDSHSLIDWYQRTHPHDASAITDRILNAA